MGARRGRRGTPRRVRPVLQDHPPGGSLELVELIDEHGPALQYDLWHYLHIDLRDVFRPGATLPNGLPITPRLLLDLIAELPEDGAFIASLRASLPPPAVDSPAVTAFRSRRRFRGWTTDTELIARVGDALIGKRFPRPGDDGVLVGDRQVVDLDALPI